MGWTPNKNEYTDKWKWCGNEGSLEKNCKGSNRKTWNTSVVEIMEQRGKQQEVRGLDKNRKNCANLEKTLNKQFLPRNLGKWGENIFF